MKHYYELVGLIPGTFAENEIQPMVEEITNVLTKAGAEFKRNETIGRRKMAYAIENMRHAYYILLGFELEGEALQKIESDLKLNKHLIRFLITKHQPKTAEQIKKEQERLQKLMQQPDKKVETKEQPTPKPKQEPQESKEEIAKELKEKEQKKLEQPVDIDALEKKLDEILDEEID